MNTDRRIKLLYDGQCPICSREIAMLRRLDRRRGRLMFEDITALGFSPERYGLTMQQVIGSMHAIRSDGSIISGMEVFREAYAAVGLGWLLAPTRWPVLRPITDVLYRAFARLRPRLSGFNGSGCENDRCVVRATAE